MSNNNCDKTEGGKKSETNNKIKELDLNKFFPNFEYMLKNQKIENHGQSFTKGLLMPLMYIGIIIIGAFLLLAYITRFGNYPWGSDTFGHLFKAHLLYQNVISGNYYPLYTELWYNGIQPFRYWAPLPYYILLIFELISKGDTLLAYNMFIFFAFVFGAMFWIVWGYRTSNSRLIMPLALLWFFMPDNLRVMFSEGNLPRVVVTIIFPYLMMGVWEFLERKSKWSFFTVFICMFLITLSQDRKSVV